MKMPKIHCDLPRIFILQNQPRSNPDALTHMSFIRAHNDFVLRRQGLREVLLVCRHEVKLFQLFLDTVPTVASVAKNFETDPFKCKKGGTPFFDKR